MPCAQCSVEAGATDNAPCSFCCCSQCSQPQAGEQVLTCRVCSSITHLRCAMDPLEREHLFTEEDLRRDLRWIEMNKPTHYECSVDCAFDVALFPNPGFSQELSSVVEASMRERWAQVCSTFGISAEEMADANLLELGEDAWAAYLQLRHDAWLEYFSTAAFSTHPLLTPPAMVELSDGFMDQLAALTSPAGQARRLFMLGTAHAIGSVVALPRDKLWKPFTNLPPRSTSSCVAESATALINKANVVTPSLKRRVVM